MITRRERTVLGATCVLAVAAPFAMAHELDRRVQDELAPAMSKLTGQPVRVGGVEADLTGVVRLRDVVVGELLRADAVEAAVSLDSLLSGQLGADEIRVQRPRVNVHVDADGRSDWHAVLDRVAAQLRARGPAAPGARRAPRLRRVVVSGGDLVADAGGLRITVRDVALHPQAGGVRVVTGAATLGGDVGPYRLDGTLGRVGADVRLPALAVDRVVAVGGRGQLRAPGAELTATAVELLRDRPGGAWRLRAELDDRGAPRPVELIVHREPTATAITVRGDRVPLAALAPLVPAGVGVERAHASGTITAARGLGTAIRAELTIDGAWIDHAAIAEDPVPVDGTISLDAAQLGPRLDVTTLRVQRGGLALTLEGWARLDGGRPVALDATAAFAPASCRALIDALPVPLRGPLDQLVVEGTIAGAAQVAFDLDDRAAAGDGVRLALDLDPRTCRVAADPPAADPATLTGAAEHRFPDGHTAMVGPGLGDWVELASLPSHVRGAFVAAEDARFWDHGGFDLDQIARSLEVDLRERRFARGGSTISQQLVKNAFLDHRRTLTRKLQEAVLTWRLEAVLDKRAILARYLNIIELGPGVFGLGAAARHYFGKPAADLSVTEVAFLAALTPAPRTISARLLRHHGLDPETAERVAVILRAMRRAGVIDADTARRAADSIDDDGLHFRPAAVGR